MKTNRQRFENEDIETAMKLRNAGVLWNSPEMTKQSAEKKHLKLRAKRLTKALKERLGVAVIESDSFALVAAEEGFPNWDMACSSYTFPVRTSPDHQAVAANVNPTMRLPLAGESAPNAVSIAGATFVTSEKKIPAGGQLKSIQIGAQTQVWRRRHDFLMPANGAVRQYKGLDSLLSDPNVGLSPDEWGDGAFFLSVGPTGSGKSRAQHEMVVQLAIKHLNTPVLHIGSKEFDYPFEVTHASDLWNQVGEFTGIVVYNEIRTPIELSILLQWMSRGAKVFSTMYFSEIGHRNPHQYEELITENVWEHLQRFGARVIRVTRIDGEWYYDVAMIKG